MPPFLYLPQASNPHKPTFPPLTKTFNSNRLYDPVLRTILEEIKLVLQCKKNSGSLKGEKNFCEKCTQTLSIGTYWSLLSPSNSINPMETENFEDEKRRTQFASLENKNTFYIFLHLPGFHKAPISYLSSGKLCLRLMFGKVSKLCKCQTQVIWPEM